MRLCMSDFAEFVGALMESTGYNQPRLAQELGVTQPTVARWLSGSEPKFEAREKVRSFAERIGFKMSSRALASDLPRLVLQSRLNLVGRIGAGAQIDVGVEQVPEGGEPIETVIPLPAGAIGFEVVGDSMWPRYDPGDVIVCVEDGVPLETIPDGDEAAVRTVEGLRYLKRLIRAEVEGLFNLESHNAPAIRAVEIVWASDVVAVIRASKWRRISDVQRSRLVQKAMAQR